MAFNDSYADFVAGLTSWMDNDDAVARIDDFIALAHAKLNRKLRIESMVSRVYATTVAGEAHLQKPTGYRGMRRLKAEVDSTTRRLIFKPLATLDAETSYNVQGVPEVYTVIGSELRLGPIPNGAYTLDIAYYQEVPTLSATQVSNAFLTAVPDLLLYACLTEASPWLDDVEMAVVWKNKYDGTLADIQDDTEDSRFPDGQLAMSTE